MQKIASYMELVLSVFLMLVIAVIMLQFMVQNGLQLCAQPYELTYYLEHAMTLAIGIEFVKMLCTHTPETIIDVLLFAISRQMIVEHLSAMDTILGVGAIAGLFAVRKYLLSGLKEA